MALMSVSENNDSRNQHSHGSITRLFFVSAALLTGLISQAQSQGLGCVASPAEAFATHPHARIATTRGADRPKLFSLAADLPAVGDQGETGSCVGWSTAYYCYSTSIARQRKLSPEERKDSRFLFSPAFIWHQFNEGNPKKGMHIYQAFDMLAKQGCATLADMPWKESDVDSKPSEAAKTRAERYKARQAVSLFKGSASGEAGDPDKLRNWLWEIRQPFVIGIPVYQEFFHVPHDADFVYKPTDNKGALAGLHAVCIVGYDEDKHAFLMVNSWSEKWANKGFVWLDEDFVAKQGIEGWGQRPGGPIARTTEPVKLTPNIILEPAQKVEKSK